MPDNPIIQIVAQNGTPAAGENPGAGTTSGSGGWPGGGMGQMVLMFALIYAVIYFMLIRPQRKQQQDQQRLLEGLKKGDRVQTSGGLFGEVVSVDRDSDQVVLRVDESQDVRVRVVRSSIVSILPTEAPESAAAK